MKLLEISSLKNFKTKYEVFIQLRIKKIES